MERMPEIIIYCSILVGFREFGIERTEEEILKIKDPWRRKKFVELYKKILKERMLWKNLK